MPRPLIDPRRGLRRAQALLWSGSAAASQIDLGSLLNQSRAVPWGGVFTVLDRGLRALLT